MGRKLDAHEKRIRAACRVLDRAVEARRQAEQALDAAIAAKRADAGRAALQEGKTRE